MALDSTVSFETFCYVIIDVAVVDVNEDDDGGDGGCEAGGVPAAAAAAAAEQGLDRRASKWALISSVTFSHS